MLSEKTMLLGQLPHQQNGKIGPACSLSLACISKVSLFFIAFQTGDLSADYGLSASRAFNAGPFW